MSPTPDLQDACQLLFWEDGNGSANTLNGPGS